MKLKDILLVASDDQMTSVVISGCTVSGSADALYTYLGNQALEGIADEVRAEDNVMKIWVEVEE